MKIELHNGNNIDVLKTFEDNSIDSIVTDPPYGLGKEPDARLMLQSWLEFDYMEVSGGGFMGKKWDAFVPQPRFWKEVYRVLKPGGHVLSFYGTRTYDWGVMAMRLAGFEIRDTVMWLYGCLSDDTEILTDKGFVKYSRNYKNDKINLYTFNVETGELNLEKIEKWFEYEYNDTAFRIESDFTEQIVSRNHRVVVEREGKLIYQQAETLEQQENIPILENMQSLSSSIYDFHKRTSNKKRNLFAGVQECYTGKKTKKMCNTLGRNQLSSLWKSISNKKEKNREILQLRMFWQIKRLAKNLFGQWKGEKESQKRIEIRKESRLERWCYLLQKTRKLYWRQICKMSTRLYSNGEKGRLCYGTPFNNGYDDRTNFIEVGSGSSYRPQPEKQFNSEFDVVQNESRPQTLRGGLKYRTTLATITPIHYEGIVFCPNTKAGAFIARRNGKIFITGNSGFPKSLNIGKQIDKMLGNERENNGYIPNGMNNVFGNGMGGGRTLNYSKGNTEWEGWGTALKPAVEPIVLARKPISEGNIAQNVLRWRTGGINIDECRVEHNEESKTTNRNSRNAIWNDDNCGFDNANNNIASANSLGRFPANVIHDGSEEVVAGFPEQNGEIGRPNRTIKNEKFGMFNLPSRTTDYGTKDSGSASRFFYTAKAHSSERNYGLEGFEEKRSSNYGNNGFSSANPTFAKASNHHPTVKPLSLMQYLVRLITPKGGVCLDAFMGSGTTGMACKLEGFDFIGIELETEYFNIAKARIDAVGEVTEIKMGNGRLF